MFNYYTIILPKEREDITPIKICVYYYGGEGGWQMFINIFRDERRDITGEMVTHYLLTLSAMRGETLQ